VARARGRLTVLLGEDLLLPLELRPALDDGVEERHLNDNNSNRNNNNGKRELIGNERDREAHVRLR